MAKELNYYTKGLEGCLREYQQEVMKLNKEIEDLQKQVEQGDHYKHLYSEVKKQKDDVVEYIKSYLQFRKEFDLDKVLRMLGEIDVED